MHIIRSIYWLSTTVVVKSLFVHAGLTKEHLSCYNDSISDMNDNEINRHNNGNYERTKHSLVSLHRRMNLHKDAMPHCVSVKTC